MRLVSLFQVAVDMRRWPSAESGDYEIMVFPNDEVTDIIFTLEITMIS